MHWCTCGVRVVLLRRVDAEIFPQGENMLQQPTLPGTANAGLACTIAHLGLRHATGLLKTIKAAGVQLEARNGGICRLHVKLLFFYGQMCSTWPQAC